MEADTRPEAISLFSGAGGLDIGLERAGWHVVAANDFDDDCMRTLSLNKEAALPIPGTAKSYLDGTKLLAGPIQDLAPADFRPSGRPSGWAPDLLVGGPPCQPFSSAGKQLSVNDHRGRLFEHFIELAATLRPRAVLFENVRGLATARGPRGLPGEALDAVRKGFEEAGYATTVSLLNAADYGVPQRRVRLFLLGVRAGSLPQFPMPTHARIPGFGQQPWVSLGDFLARRTPPAADEIVRPSRELVEQLEGIPDGSGLKSPGRSEPTRPSGHWGYKQGTFIADPILPARTVTAATTQDWVRGSDGQLRRLTLRECQALQGFPDDWMFAGAKASQFRQIGNAVPTQFGELLGTVLLRELGRGPEVRPVSAPLPAAIRAAIDYSRRDESRNGVVRPRSPLFMSEIA